MEYSLLDKASLSDDAQRVLSSGASKMMAARGMAPLANPADLVSVLYQLCQDGEEETKSAAQKSSKGLPKTILAGALADTSLDPRVIDYFIQHADCRAELVNIVALNSASADSTIVVLAKVAKEKSIEIIAQNQERLMRHPAIISAIYTNPKARMSTVDRIVEFAVRQQLKVPGIPAWDEVSRAVLHEGAKEGAKEEPAIAEVQEADDFFLALLPEEGADLTREEPLSEEIEVAIRDMSIPAKLRLAMLGNKSQRNQLIRDPKKMVALAAIKSPGMKEMEVAEHAGNKALCDDVIAYIANKKEWTTNRKIRTALVKNPKCPLPVAMRLLPFLRANELSQMARSRGIPSALAAQARKLSNARRGGRGGK